ncbi:rod shape-determining protein RodA [Rhodovarius crocodyli]|uniref:Peptidoglycan glycosyltransferase MrdB n=1 Tax=Rhodovarius crocodyli TaxID=1979269 RepID=A0A437MGV4_9PROT|nr:rod shape-determining protein RodA [Rhodovarius crocodyli]RVT96876.1 rod shape-determining protein RodA [Rhodovarius crocodyli]
MSITFEKRLLTRNREHKLLEKLWRVPWVFVLLLIAVAGVGYVALYSAGSGNPDLYATKHALRFAFCLVMALCIGLIDIKVIYRLSWPLYGISLALLVLVAVRGQVGKGAQRWVDLGPIQLQPSEMMKIALVALLAAWFARATWKKIGNVFFLVPAMLLVFVPAGLIFRQPNLGTSLITVAVGGVMFWVAGVRWWKFGLAIGAAASAVPIVYANLRDYQRARISTFFDPENDPLGAGYNIIQSKIALGSGGIWGKGFLGGTQGHLNFLPEKQTDFIFTMIAEEFGFVGAMATLGLLMLVVLFCIYAGFMCKNHFGRLLCFGIGANYFFYIFVNIAMVTGSIPVGGVPLPLISHGGSAMLTVMLGFGLVMSAYVHRHADLGPARE